MKQHADKSGAMTCDTVQRAIALAAASKPRAASADETYSEPGTALFLVEADALFPFPTGSGDGWNASSFVDVYGSQADTEEPSEETHYAAAQNERLSQDLGLPQSGPLAEHLHSCRACQSEMAATTAFFRALARDTGPEPSPTLLARARMQLDATLDTCEQVGFWSRLSQQLAFTAGRLRAAPALCSALLLVGLLAGGYGGFRAGSAAHAAEQTALLLAPPAPETPSVVADVSSISRDPSTGLVEVHYDRLVSDTLTAPADDPSIRELLMAATENGIDPQVRNISVGLLSGGCRTGAACDTSPVRNALMNALETDKTAEVRREALAGLQPLIAEDTEVRDAVLAALMNDASASVRIEAVRVLQSVGVDSSVRQVLHTVSLRDGDPLIRSASLEALKSVPQLQ